MGAQPIRDEWHDRWDLQEEALRHRLGRNVDKMEARAHDLRPLDLQAHVRVQNQTGGAPRRWDRTGVVVGRNLALDKYWVKMDGSRRVTERNRKFLRQFKPATTGLEEPTGYRAAPVQQKQDSQKQDPQKQDSQKQDYQEQGTPPGDQSRQGPAREARDNVASPARSPATPEFATPRSSPMISPPAAGQSGAGRSTPRPVGRPVARRKVTFNLEQGETEPQAAAEPPQQEVLPPAAPQAIPQPPARANDRPRREVRRPAWQRDFDMGASALQVRCSDRDNAEASNSVEGVLGHVKDDFSAAESRQAGQCGKGPPGGRGGAARAAAMPGSVAEILNKLLALVANDSDVEEGQASVKDGAVIKNGED